MVPGISLQQQQASLITVVILVVMGPVEATCSPLVNNERRCERLCDKLYLRTGFF